ncbi:MAG: hypothetical protein A2104_06165 [Candidatus Melainabacteria bacterium GWF2_32_7]|nr:MAG: hypothetical protein A2104_06165 [Candidatus Melainabacteria bacterium GWF2_32_7]
MQIETALQYLQNGDLQQSKVILEQILGQNPDNPNALYWLGIIFYQVKDYNQAIYNISKAIEINSTDQYCFDLGQIFLELNLLNESIHYLRNTLTLNPQKIEAYYCLGEALFKANNFEEAATCFQMFIQVYPDDVDAYFNLGISFLKIKKTQEAIIAFKKAIELDPNAFDFYYNLGIAYLKENNWQETINSFEKAIKLKPDNADMYHLLGVSYLMIGFHDKESEENFEKANYYGYLNWIKNSSKKRIYKLTENPEIKFAIVYFYEGDFQEDKYNRLIEHLEGQTYKNYDVFQGYVEKIDNYSHVCFVEQGDLIPEYALSCLAETIQQNKDLELIYSDEDIYNCERINPYFKPEYSPLLLLSHNYMNSLLCLKINNNLIQELKNTEKIDQKYLYKLVLKLTREKINLLRIPDVLYHRHLENSQKQENSSMKNIVLDEIQERQYNADIVDYKLNNFNLVKFYPETLPKVSIIIPFKDKVNFLKECIKSIEEKTTYKNYEIILVNNRSIEPDTLNYLKTTKYRVLDADIDFNFSKLNNMASDIAEGEYLIFLNNDMTVITSDWIENMLGIAQLSFIGAVGAKLLYPDDTIQHVGIVRSNDEFSHVNKSMNKDCPGYKSVNDIIRESSCITGACIMISKDKFYKIGKFNEELAVVNNDIELCLNLLKSGYYNVYTPHSVLYHHESVSRVNKFNEQMTREKNYLREKWQDFLSNSDPFYNPNLKDCYFCVKTDL